MTPTAYVRRVRAGVVEARGGFYDAAAGALVSDVRPLTLENPAAVTAEALNAGVEFESDDWDAALREVTAAIARTGGAP